MVARVSKVRNVETIRLKKLSTHLIWAAQGKIWAAQGKIRAAQKSSRESLSAKVTAPKGERGSARRRRKFLRGYCAEMRTGQVECRAWNESQEGCGNYLSLVVMLRAVSNRVFALRVFGSGPSFLLVSPAPSTTTTSRTLKLQASEYKQVSIDYDYRYVDLVYQDLDYGTSFVGPTAPGSLQWRHSDRFPDPGHSGAR
ncbi:hypothetical protein B0H14DRAFT_2619001 [Mycena olivaceomarginata]|nr:hypothetical protein B0H14DRAFT_2619001 [Mycena olivaceomarginata]